MDFDNMSKRKKFAIISGLMIPLVVSIVMLFYLQFSWQIPLSGGEKFSPIDNKPLFVGLLMFTVGYLFFLGMMFNENIMQLFNSRFHLRR